MELSCVILLSLRHAAIESGSISSTSTSPFVLALFSLCGESQAPSAGVWYVFLLTYTHPQLQRNASYFWAPKVIQTSSLFLVLPLLDHCSFFCFARERVCFWSAGHSLLRCLFRRSTCSLCSEQVHCLSQAYVFFSLPVTAALCRVLR